MSDCCVQSGNVAGVPPAGTGVADVNACPSRFCDDKLVNMGRVTGGFDAVGVPPGSNCMARYQGPAGIWQFDPNRAGGDTFTGPVERLTIPASNPIAEGTFGHLPILTEEINPETCTKDELRLLHQLVRIVNQGDLAVLSWETTQGAGRKLRVDALEPDTRGCVEGHHFLGYIENEVQIGGDTVFQKTFTKMKGILLNSTDADEFFGYNNVDFSETNEWLQPVFKVEGTCAKLGYVATTAGQTGTCEDIDTTTTFDSVFGCKGGVQKQMRAVDLVDGVGIVRTGAQSNPQMASVQLGNRVFRYQTEKEALSITGFQQFIEGVPQPINQPLTLPAAPELPADCWLLLRGYITVDWNVATPGCNADYRLDLDSKRLVRLDGQTGSLENGAGFYAACWYDGTAPNIILNQIFEVNAAPGVDAIQVDDLKVYLEGYELDPGDSTGGNFLLPDSP